MMKHAIRFLLALQVAALFAGLLHMVAIHLFITDFGDIEAFADRIEAWGVTWIALLVEVAAAAGYTWVQRKKPLFGQTGK